ncbi:MAG: GNAT family N-acetyltransferase [Methylococcus sp.]|nr:GNAT family N-acetyltransferase [Methylococcus sp.]
MAAHYFQRLQFLGYILKLEWKNSLEGVDWNELAALYRAAPLGEKSPSDLEKVFSNSLYRFFVYDDGQIVGVGRALADGADCSYICDVAVLPSHQGTGIGKGIVGKLVALSAGHKKIILYSVPGKESFYRSLGFKRMTTAMAIFESQSQALERGLVNEI